MRLNSSPHSYVSAASASPSAAVEVKPPSKLHHWYHLSTLNPDTTLIFTQSSQNFQIEPNRSRTLTFRFEIKNDPRLNSIINLRVMVDVHHLHLLVTKIVENRWKSTSLWSGDMLRCLLQPAKKTKLKKMPEKEEYSGKVIQTLALHSIPLLLPLL